MTKFITHLAFLLLLSCTKQVGKNPELAYSDKALIDSCRQPHYYYKGSPQIRPATGPHGSHMLRFNGVAKNELDSGWNIQKGQVMPDGSLIIKDTYDGSSVTIFSMMYKKSGRWLWFEAHTNGEVIHSVKQNAAVCTGCHGAGNNRDFILSFK